MTVKKTRLLIVVIICSLMIVAFFPIPTTVVPQWRLQVVDVNGSACPNMRVTQDWGHYSLYTDGNSASEDRLTDANGYVQFPKRTIRASVTRRLIMPVITRIQTIMHGGWGADGAVWASGIKDVAWLSYKEGKPLPDKMRVEKCINSSTEQLVGSSARYRRPF